ncbi:MAG: hypothetical protein IKE10_01675 [Bacilli bacterium]|nr:hypothetical protein [Bacilli bacterium]
MFNKIKNSINLTKASLYLEKINTGTVKQKDNAYEKLKKIPLTEDIALRIIENASYKYDKIYESMNINSMILLLLFNDYKKEYSEPLMENYDNYDKETQLDLLSYLANANNIDATILWKYLIINKFEPEDNKLPIGTLSNNKDNYDVLYPDLYDAFKSDNKKYSLIILLNNFINLGIVPIDDLKKHKKDLIKHISMPIEELLKFKFMPGEDIMLNKEYLGLRYVVESTLNIEFYCNNPKTKTYLEKLFKHKDNQLKLFVLESYIKKKKSIKKLNLNPIAKDLRSRSLLYNLLIYYNKSDVMPKKYKDEISIAESDFYNMYSSIYNYEREPKSIKFYKQIDRNGNPYYLFKFKAKKEYNEIVRDFATDYLLKNNGLDKYITDVYEDNLGIIGGRTNDDPLISYSDITKYYDVFNKQKSLDCLIDEFFRKEEVVPEIKSEPEEKVIKHPILRKIFNITNLYILQLVVILLLVVILVLYVKGYNIFNIKMGMYKQTYITYKKTNINKLEDFNEINGHDIYKIDDGIYYVLIFKKKDESEYYTFFKTLIENEYKVYYIDMSKEENQFLLGPNETGHIIKSNRFVKVNDRDFEYYIDGKENILKELKDETNEVIKNNTLKKIEEENERLLEEEKQKEVENASNE